MKSSLLRRYVRAVLLEDDGFYPYEIERGVDVHGFWYRSPGRTPGADGDPGRPSDAAEYIGMKKSDVEGESEGSSDVNSETGELT